MKNQKEIYIALIEGETLISAFCNIKVKLIDGALKDIKGKGQEDQTFRAPENWKIYKEPRWYENIPDGGVLCRVNGEKTVNSIEDYNPKYNNCF